MTTMNVSKRNIGLIDQGESWKLRVWAPDARMVQMKLPAKDVILDLKTNEYGYWEVNTNEISPGDLYWLLVDGKELPDPASLSQPDGVHGASQATSTAFAWDESDWDNPALKDYIIYELHTGTFTPPGDFKGIEDKLDYLVDLGITAIEIMPVASFPGERNWGYDGVFPFAVQHSYGGPAGLQQLVAACHRKGLAVVLDVVYNHLGPEGNYLPEFGPYFTDKYGTPWGNAVNFDDRNAHGVREYFIENALMWFRDFHVDALRLDAVHAIKDFSATHILQEIKMRTDLLRAKTGRKYYLLAECDLNDPRYISPVEVNGLGMDGQWVDEFHHALRVAAGEPKAGYYSDFNGISHLGKSFRDAYVYTGEYSEERRNFFGRSAQGHPAQQFVVFSQNHDQVGNRMLGERTGSLVGFELQKLMAATVLCGPFVPLLFMGEEWGETNPFLYFIDHGDPKLVELVRNGRKAEFAALHASGEAPDPKDRDTFLRSKINWQATAEKKHAVLRQFYKALITLRKTELVLQAADLAAVRVKVFEQQNCLIVERGITGEKQRMLCMMNFSAEVRQLAIGQASAIYTKILDSADPKWLGPSASPERLNFSVQELPQQLIIQPQSFLAYTTL